jgi:hypothetical protein
VRVMSFVLGGILDRFLQDRILVGGNAHIKS